VWRFQHSWVGRWHINKARLDLGISKASVDLLVERVDDLGGRGWQSIVTAFRPAVLDCDVASLDLARFAQALAERAQNGARIPSGRLAVQEPDHRRRRLLRARRERPGGSHTAEQRDEFAAFHSITSSARAMSVGGTSRPSALAAVVRRSCYNKAHDLEHGFHTPALLGES
jgi:hypothetical protein